MVGYIIPAFAAAAIAIGVQAEKNPYDSAGQNGGYLVPYVGGYNVMSSDSNKFQDGPKSVMGGVEYRFSAWKYGFRPVVGALANTRGDAYAYGGFVVDVPLYKDRFWFVPGFDVGAFEHGNGRSLGGALEFRSSAELAYRFDNNHRIGIGFSHISNAKIYTKNPGTEMATVHYSIPFSW